MTSSLKRILVLATAIASVTTMWAFTYSIQVFDQPVGPECPADMIFEVKDINGELGGFEGTIESSGTPTFSTTEVIRLDGQPARVRRTFQSLGGKGGNNPEVGDIAWEVDFARQTVAETGGTGVSSITANQLDSDLPATADIKVYLTATISSLPGRVFKSETQARFTNNNITTYPLVNETLTIAEPVDFYDEATGEVVFRIKSGTGTVTSE